MRVRKFIENGFSLYRRGNGYWYYTVYDANGKRWQKSTGTNGSKTEARSVCFQRAREGSLLEGCVVGREDPPVVFGKFAADFYDYDRCPYIRSRLARGFSYQRKTAANYRYYLLEYIMPAFGKRRMNEITVAEINGWLLDLPEEKHISNKTANTMLSLMRQILRMAVENGILESNPADKVRPLAKKKGEKVRVPFTKNQVTMILSYGWNDVFTENACRLAACTGMRIGEICALERKNVFPDHILVSASYNNRKDGLKCTKSGYERVVPISSEIYRMLISMKGERFLFSPDGSNPFIPNVIENRLARAMEDLGIRPRQGTLLSFHSFRHFLNSRLRAAGMEGDKIRAVIGHESEQMTEHYTRLELEDLKQIEAVQESITSHQNKTPGCNGV